MTYKILIVEDEKEKAKGIAYLVEKYNPLCTPVKLAHDGEKGYEMALEYQPDIILTDIRMPVMDGLEMIRALRAQSLQTEFIVLSGYAEFSYAKKAIELGVRDFITKPVDESELNTTLDKVCKEIADRKNSEDSLNKMNDDMRNYALRDFLTGGVDQHYTVREYLEEQHVLEKSRQFTCMVVEWEGEREAVFKKAEVENTETDGLYWIEDCFLYGVKTGRTQITVILAADNLDVEKKRKLAEQILDEMKRKSVLPEACSFGVGNSYVEYTQFPNAYEEAKVALNYRILKGSKTVILYEELYDMENRTDLITEKEMEQLKERIDRFDQDGFHIAVKGIFKRVLSENQLSLPELQKLSLNIVLLGLHNIPMAQLQMNEYFGKNLFTLKSIEKFKTIEQLENWIINMVSSMNEVMLKDSVPKKKDVIAEAKDYIRQHYNQNITLNDISKQFFINPYYFSQLFKKKTGMTYQNYLISYRVDRAKKLLVETDLRIYEVCKLVGYNDVNHFNQVFDRAEGMKPSEFRQRYKQEEEENYEF